MLMDAPPRLIKQVSSDLGFSSSQSFARWFNRRTGLSPSAFRERAKRLRQPTPQHTPPDAAPLEHR
jgi:AraC-like DNA-binding protein